MEDPRVLPSPSTWVLSSKECCKVSFLWDCSLQMNKLVQKFPNGNWFQPLHLLGLKHCFLQSLSKYRVFMSLGVLITVKQRLGAVILQGSRNQISFVRLLGCFVLMCFWCIVTHSEESIFSPLIFFSLNLFL